MPSCFSSTGSIRPYRPIYSSFMMTSTYSIRVPNVSEKGMVSADMSAHRSMATLSRIFVSSAYSAARFHLLSLRSPSRLTLFFFRLPWASS